MLPFPKDFEMVAQIECELAEPKKKHLVEVPNFLRFLKQFRVAKIDIIKLIFQKDMIIWVSLIKSN